MFTVCNVNAACTKKYTTTKLVILNGVHQEKLKDPSKKTECRLH
jgi:hypothetical protein